MSRCPSCGSTSIEYDASNGSSVCTDCGRLVSESGIVNEVQWSEGTGGSSNVVGQFISTTQTNKLSQSAKRGGRGGSRIGQSISSNSSESREQTLINGRKLISSLSDRLRLRPHHTDAAYRIFQLCVSHNFLQGRRTIHVVAACTYTACRRESPPFPILLIDISDALNVSVYQLGSIFLKLLRVVGWTVTTIDPSLYIHRFANHMNLPNNAIYTVALTALRLVASMKHHWISIGRRPTGVCGACLAIAARMHGYNDITPHDVANVVRITSTTIKKRLTELIDTPHADLTPNEFEQLDVDRDFDIDYKQYSITQGKSQLNDTNNNDNKRLEPVDPPAYTAARIAETRHDTNKQLQSQLSTINTIESAFQHNKLLLEAERDSALVEVKKLIDTIDFQQLDADEQERTQSSTESDISIALPHTYIIPSRKSLKQLIKAHKQGDDYNIDEIERASDTDNEQIEIDISDEHKSTDDIINNTALTNESTVSIIPIKPEMPAPNIPHKYIPGEELRILMSNLTNDHKLSNNVERVFNKFKRESISELIDDDIDNDNDNDKSQHDQTNNNDNDTTALTLHNNINTTDTTSLTATTTEPSSELSVLDKESLSDISDSELDDYLLSAEEIAFKTRMWDELHGDYIRKQLMKRRQEREDILAGRRRSYRRKPRVGRIDTNTDITIKQLNDNNKKSTRINYDVLNTLLGDNTINQNNNNIMTVNKQRSNINATIDNNDTQSSESESDGGPAAKRLRLMNHALESGEFDESTLYDNTYGIDDADDEVVMDDEGFGE